MATRVRLQRRALTDQLGVATMFLFFGGVLVTGGVFLLGGVFGTICGVVLILLGSPLLLMVLVRFIGWRTIFWTEWLVAEAGRIVITRSPRDLKTTIELSDAVAVGLYDGPEMPVALLCVHHADRPPQVVRLPHKTEVAAALTQAAPPDWSQEPARHWPVRMIRPGTPADQIPGPGPAELAVVRLMTTENRLQLIAGTALSLFFGLSALITLVLDHGRTAHTDASGLVVTIVMGVLGAIFTSMGLMCLFALPVMVCEKWLTLDADGLTYEEPNIRIHTRIAHAWNEIRQVRVAAASVQNMWGGRRYDVQVVVELADGTGDEFDLGDEPDVIPQLENLLARYAGPRWAGVQGGNDWKTGFG